MYISAEIEHFMLMKWLKGITPRNIARKDPRDSLLGKILRHLLLCDILKQECENANYFNVYLQEFTKLLRAPMNVKRCFRNFLEIEGNPMDYLFVIILKIL